MTQSVLAIDDSPAVHELLDAWLKADALVIHHATAAADGLRKACELKPDLILLDVVMPSMGGFDICRILKADARTAFVPVIFLTGSSDCENKVQGFDLGAIDYVTKPFDAAELRARVRSALRTKRYHDLLATKAHVDALTGLWNRDYFNQRLSEEVAAAQRYRRKVSLAMIDLDHFKQINDTYGHPFGDQVLGAVGECLSDCLRTTDAPCRYGGEEFAVILTHTDLGEAMVAAKRIQERLARLGLRPRGRRVGVTASIGVASSEGFAPAVVSVMGLVAAADNALYEAKQAGRNRIRKAKTEEELQRKQ